MVKALLHCIFVSYLFSGKVNYHLICFDSFFVLFQFNKDSLVKKMKRRVVLTNQNAGTCTSIQLC